MTITAKDWQEYQAQVEKLKPRPAVTNEQRSEAIRAQTALDHPGFALLQAELCKWKDKMVSESKTAEHRLCHGRGLSDGEVHRLREDLAACSGWIKAIDVALDLLPNAVKVVRDDG